MLTLTLLNQNSEPGQCTTWTGSSNHDCCIMMILQATATILAASIFTYRNPDASLGSVKLPLLLLVLFPSIVIAEEGYSIYGDELQADVDIIGDTLSHNES